MSMNATPEHTIRLLAEAHRAARRLQRTLRLPPSDIEDLRQDLMTDLLSRLHAFDSARGTLGAFANLVISHRATRIAKRIKADRQRVGRPPVARAEPTPAESGQGRSDIFGEEQGFSALHGQAVDRFTPLEQRLDITRALAALDEPDRALCAALLHSSVSDLAAAGVGARRTLYRRLRRIELDLIAYGFRAA